MTATPMGVIAAQLGHVDTRMAEKHYAHLAPSYIADTIRANLPALRVIDDECSLEPILAAPNILNKGYTITADVEIPEGGAEGMIVTQGGRFGGYGLFLSKGEFGFDRGKVVFLYNLLDLKPDGPGLGKGGTGVLSVDGKEVARNTLEHTTPITFPEDESFDIGPDTRTAVALLEYRYDPPFRFTGKINNRAVSEARVSYQMRAQATSATP